MNQYVKTAIQVGSVVGKKAIMGAKIGKKKISELAKKVEIVCEYTKIGEYVYKNNEEFPANDNLRVHIAKIDFNRQEISRLENEIDDIINCALNLEKPATIVEESDETLQPAAE